jgi:hypothetical protein
VLPMCLNSFVTYECEPYNCFSSSWFLCRRKKVRQTSRICAEPCIFLRPLPRPSETILRRSAIDKHLPAAGAVRHKYRAALQAELVRSSCGLAHACRIVPACYSRVSIVGSRCWPSEVSGGAVVNLTRVNIFVLAPRVALTLGVLLFVLIVFADYVSSYELSLTPFYLFVVLLVTWNCVLRQASCSPCCLSSRR